MLMTGDSTEIRSPFKENLWKQQRICQVDQDNSLKYVKIRKKYPNESGFPLRSDQTDRQALMITSF